MGSVTAVAVADAAAPSKSAPLIVTKSTRRRVSTGRALGLGIATIAFGLIMIVEFGLKTSSSVRSVIVLTGSTAQQIPPLSSAMRVFVLIVGLLAVAGGVLLWRTRWRPVGVGLLVVGALLVAWPLALWLGWNDTANGMLKNLVVPVRTVSLVCGAITTLLGALVVWRRPARGAYGVFFVGMSLFSFTFLAWVARGSDTFSVPPMQLTSLLASCFIAATPLIYGSLSGIMCERSGVVNIAVEGQFLVGALVSEMVTSVIGPTPFGFAMGTIAAAVIGGVFGLVLASMALRYEANQVIVGVVIVAFCAGITTFLTNAVLEPHQSLNSGAIALPIAIPGLSKIPVIGPVLFDQNYFVYLAIALVAIINVGLFRTRWGLRTRSVGESPKAAETVGLSVVRIRYRNVVLGGAVAGIGGAVFTIGRGIIFTVGLTQGYGFIALAIMIFGRWRPWGAFAATLLFGFSIALGSQVNLYTGQFGIPPQLIAALPYLITIAAVAGLVGRNRPPAADGVPYSRE